MGGGKNIVILQKYDVAILSLIKIIFRATREMYKIKYYENINFKPNVGLCSRFYFG